MNRLFLAAGIVAMGVGMVFVYAGVLVTGVFLIGVVLIGVGIVLTAAAGIMSIVDGKRAVEGMEP